MTPYKIVPRKLSVQVQLQTYQRAKKSMSHFLGEHSWIPLEGSGVSSEFLGIDECIYLENESPNIVDQLCIL